ncbi:hypothetical protein PBRA_002158 [Plasmodiophora brassicae]|uniref:Dymeclin n=1 Tax=Plasmodiophora brassicae TaxID=37360 RepID=A0A0G4J1Z2_PLABS|nr:hypothetical protein PBRA_002158 [Plasmodiophora brassicae]
MGGGLSVAEQRLVEGDQSDLGLLSGRRSLPPDHAFWSRLHLLRFSLDHLDASQVSRVIDITCSQMVKNNLESRNLNVLLAIVCERLGETVAGSPVVPTTTNLVFLARTFMKYFCEKLPSDQLREHLEPAVSSNVTHAVAIAIVPVHSKSMSHLPIPQRLLNVVVDACARVPLTDDTMDFHVELQNLLLVLFSTQMFAGSSGSNLFLDELFDTLAGKFATFCQVLLARFVRRAPVSMISPVARTGSHSSPSWFQSLRESFVSVLLWPFQIYRVLFAKSSAASQISDSAAFLLLVLAHQGGRDDNAFREVLSAAADADNDEQTRAAGIVTVSFDRVFEALVHCLFERSSQDWAVSLLFTMLHSNKAFCDFLYSKSDVDCVVMPMLEMAYSEERFDSSRIYTIIVILIILSSDDSFCDNAHRRLVISNVPWFSEFHLSDISLGSLIMAVILRTIQRNQATLRDAYLHSSCLAALSNLAPHTTGTHRHTAQRLVGLLGGLSRRYQRLCDRGVIASRACTSDQPRVNVSRRQSFCEDDLLSPGDIVAFQQYVRTVLDIVCACLTNGSLGDNVPLLYCLMHDQRILEPFHHDRELGHVAEYLWIIVHDFINRLSQRALPDDCSVATVQNVLRVDARTYSGPPGLEVPTIQKFYYEDSEDTESFFRASAWEAVFKASPIPWAPHVVSLFDAKSGADDTNDIGRSNGSVKTELDGSSEPPQQEAVVDADIV